MVNLIRSILTFGTQEKYVDVNNLFRLVQLSPQLQDLALKKLEEFS